MQRLMPGGCATGWVPWSWLRAVPEPLRAQPCHDDVVGTGVRATVRALTWPVAPLLLAATVASVARSPAAGPAISLGELPYLAAMIACWLVGVVLTGRVFVQPAGWAFLGLGTALAWSAVTDVYTGQALHWEPTAPGAALAATTSETSFVWWFVFLALVLQLTPPADFSGRFRHWLTRVTIASGILFQAAALMRSTPLEPPYQHVVSPWAVTSLSGLMATIAAVAVSTLGLALIASAVWLVRVWRRAEGQSRQQLLWLMAGVLPLPPAVLASFGVSYAGHEEVAGLLMSVAIVAVAIGAALSVLRYRLYDVERVVSDSGAYAIAAAAVTVTFGAVVVVISRTTPIAATSQLPTVLATLAGAGAARVSYGWARTAVDKRLNRERYDAVTAVRSGLTGPASDLDGLLSAALNDPTARVLYPAEGGAWVTSGGRAVLPAEQAVEVRRHGAVTAQLDFDPERNDRSVVEAVAQEAAAEIDNVALRAELSRQVELINESRSRIAAAHVEERRRIERDLHDGAQQRLLAMALQLQSARLNGQTHVLQEEVRRAISELGATVQELRDLAGGLQPAALAGGGLLGAVSDLAVRAPVPITYDVPDRRFPTDVESAAWFVIAEATTNAAKHAACNELSITVIASDDVIRVVVVDTGIGGADPSGRGLQGLSDRVAALQGCLRVSERSPHGTVVEAELPCES